MYAREFCALLAVHVKAITVFRKMTVSLILFGQDLHVLKSIIVSALTTMLAANVLAQPGIHHLICGNGLGLAALVLDAEAETYAVGLSRSPLLLARWYGTGLFGVLPGNESLLDPENSVLRTLVFAAVASGRNRGGHAGEKEGREICCLHGDGFGPWRWWGLGLVKIMMMIHKTPKILAVEESGSVEIVNGSIIWQEMCWKVYAVKKK